MSTPYGDVDANRASLLGVWLVALACGACDRQARGSPDVPESWG